MAEKIEIKNWVDLREENERLKKEVQEMIDKMLIDIMSCYYYINDAWISFNEGEYYITPPSNKPKAEIHFLEGFRELVDAQNKLELCVKRFSPFRNVSLKEKIREGEQKRKDAISKPSISPTEA